MQKYSTQNFNSGGLDVEHGKHWDYLGSIHSMYMYMMHCYKDYMVSKKNNGNIINTLNTWKVSISIYRFMVKYNFDNYLIGLEKCNIEPKHYDFIFNIEDEDAIYDLMSMLIHWSQAEGVFKLEVEKRDPLKWFLND
jgi:hypothetical protein